MDHRLQIKVNITHFKFSTNQATSPCLPNIQSLLSIEALAAIGLASNLLQFVDCSTKIVKSCWKLWRDEEDCLDENRELEIAVTSLQGMLRKLETGAACSVDDMLSSLIQECFKLASDLLTLLGRLRKKQGKKKFDKLVQSLVLSMSQIVKKKEIEDLKERVDTMRDAIFVRLNFHLHNRLNDLGSISIDSSEILSGIPRSTPLGEAGLAMRRKIADITKGLNDLEEDHATMLNAASQLEMLVKELPTLQPEMVKFNKTRALVSSLHFRQIRERESEVVAAHAETFEWVFRDGGKANFKDWLRADAGIYWVSGKPGSGKSTLMKFMVRHPETRRLLRNWAHNHTLVMARHFFWGAGPPIQKSQVGLLRTVLFDLLVNCPDLAPVLCPTRWNHQPLLGLDDWTQSELLDSLNNLSSAAKLPIRVCLFIDGLDEYSGNHVELAKVLLALAALPNIKVCTSSRPWVDFQDAFGSSQWKLYVHELTASDINVFVADMFLANQQFCNLQASNSKDAEYLMAEIRTRAQGVFLWVFLVVRSLLRGLTNEDSMSDLNRRLRQIPVELEDFFRRMLDNIDQVYWQRTARLLQLVKCASGPIPLLTMLYLDLDGCAKSSRQVVTLDIWPDVCPEVAEMVRVKKRQITAQCKDILHLTTTPNQPTLLGERLGPLHRTVVDFLKTDQVDQLLYRRAGPNFEHWTMLFNATVGQIRELAPMSRLVHISESLPIWMGDVIDYGRHIEADYGHAETETLNDLEKALAHYSASRRWSLEYCLSTILGQAGCRCFLELAVKHGLMLYATQKVQLCSNAERLSMLECAMGGQPCADVEKASTIHRTEWRNTGVLNHLIEMGILPSPEMVSRGFAITTRRGSIPAHESSDISGGNDDIIEAGPSRRKTDRQLWSLVSRIFR